MLPWLSPKLLEQMQTLKNDQALPYYYKFLHLGLPSYHRGFFGSLTSLTPKKKCTYITHTISQVKMCCSWQFGHLQWNSCRLHTCQTSIQDKNWPLLPITIARLYIHTYGIRLHEQTCTIERDQWIITQWNIDK